MQLEINLKKQKKVINMELNLNQPENIIMMVALIAFLVVVIIVMASFCTIGIYNKITKIEKTIEDYLKTKN
jgi:hypothetical protein